MKIGFDAKRVFHNVTGLGHYSRSLTLSLAKYFPEHEYFLFNPKPSNLFQAEDKNLHEVLPGSMLNRILSSLWRSNWVKKDLQRLKIDLYHGLSNEIPFEIHKTNIRSVVTIHDLIFERFPEQYSKIDVEIYRRKFRYACLHADKVIAISEQTKKDIIEFYQTPEKKISVCYQSCNASFTQPVSAAKKQLVKEKYSLPDEFFLYVGSIIERKNLLNICKAIYNLRNDLSLPLVVIGNGSKYKQQVKEYIKQRGIENQILFLSENPLAKVSSSFLRADDFPAIYQSAIAMIYPSFFEGFGLPVLEASCSGLPVITSNVSSLTEAGGNGAYYVNPESAEEIAQGMKKIWSDDKFAESLKEKGLQHAQNFSQQNTASAVMEVYKTIW